jgi:CubicO group peptidase (beta-lactamase class C family)
MKKNWSITTTVLLAALATAMFGSKINGEGNQHFTVCHRDSAFLDSVVDWYMGNDHLPGLAASIVKDGSIIWKNAYGWANIERQIPAADTTIWLVGSISKTVTAVAAMQAWEQGLYGLDDNINRHLPFLVRSPHHPNDSITPRMLLVHTSSILKNPYVMNPLYVYGGDSPIPLDTLLYNYLTPGGYWYYPNGNFNYSVPGTVYEYSGIGNSLAGYFTQVVTGDSFPIFCQENIFAPLGMNRTAWFYENLDTNNIAMSYSYAGGQQVPFGFPGKPNYPSGNLKSSIVDMSRFLITFMQYGRFDTIRILDSTTVHLMRTVQDTINAAFQQYIGITWWYYLSPSGRWCWGHAGAWAGYWALMIFCPDENTGAIVLTNGEGTDMYILGSMLQTFLDWAAQYGIADNTFEPAQIVRLQVTPNPFHSKTNIRYSILDTRSLIRKPTIGIYDAAGRLVKSFNLESSIENQESTVVWDGRDAQNRMLGSGVYFIKLTSGNMEETKKVLFVK